MPLDNNNDDWNFRRDATVMQPASTHQAASGALVTLATGLQDTVAMAQIANVSEQ